MGHRGGFFGPENSMSGFKGAIDNKLEGIEFDVSKLFQQRWWFKSGICSTVYQNSYLKIGMTVL